MSAVMQISRFNELKNQVLEGKVLTKEEILSLQNEDVDELAEAADEIRQQLAGNDFDLCTIINGKCGKCSEDCRYCAQSVHFNTNIKEHGFLPIDVIVKRAVANYEKGANRFSIVCSGKRLTKQQVDYVAAAYKEIRKACNIGLCGSLGLLDQEDFNKLKEAGLSRFHNNLEASRNFFPHICTTHTYDDKIATLKAAQKAEVGICSGGIIGMGETMEDRIDMAITLRELGATSVPINVLNPIKGTPLENQPKLPYDEVRKTVALFRFTLPAAQIRLAGGRSVLEDGGAKTFKGGANAAITGDLLTTDGPNIDNDVKNIEQMGYDL